MLVPYMNPAQCTRTDYVPKMIIQMEGWKIFNSYFWWQYTVYTLFKYGTKPVFEQTPPPSAIPNLNVIKRSRKPFCRLWKILSTFVSKSSNYCNIIPHCFTKPRNYPHILYKEYHCSFLGIESFPSYWICLIDGGGHICN